MGSFMKTGFSQERFFRSAGKLRRVAVVPVPCRQKVFDNEGAHRDAKSKSRT